MLKIQRKPETVSKTLRLPINVVRRLDKITCINNLSLNQIVIQCLTYALQEINTEDEKKPQEK